MARERVTPEKPPVASAKSKTAPIDPTQYIIKRGFTHDGIVFGRGEPVPAMTTRSAETLRAEGKIALLTEEGVVETRFARVPENVNDYMRGNDLTVMQRIRANPPSIADLEEIVERAKRGRTQLFREALAVVLDLARAQEKPPKKDKP